MVSDPTADPLPRARGYEIGFRTRQFERIEFSAVFWLLYLNSEPVFVGVEGVTEADDPTRRMGSPIPGIAWGNSSSNRAYATSLSRSPMFISPLGICSRSWEAWDFYFERARRRRGEDSERTARDGVAKRRSIPAIAKMLEKNGALGISSQVDYGSARVANHECLTCLRGGRV